MAWFLELSSHLARGEVGWFPGTVKARPDFQSNHGVREDEDSGTIALPMHLWLEA